jgi:type I restriction enzyme R subunit
VNAIQTVDAPLGGWAASILVAIARCNGKTRTITVPNVSIAENRALPSNTLSCDAYGVGAAATDAFDEALLEQNQPRSKTYNVGITADEAHRGCSITR